MYLNNNNNTFLKKNTENQAKHIYRALMANRLSDWDPCLYFH